jgi:lysophospholipase L1-like esterase
LVLFNKLFKWLVSQHVASCAELSIRQTWTALEGVQKFASYRGLKLLIVLQPNIFMSKRFSNYENKLQSRFSTILEDQVRYAYPRFIEWGNSALDVISFTGIFDQTSEVVFVDWVHLNARGHELLAEHLYDTIRSKLNY